MRKADSQPNLPSSQAASLRLVSAPAANGEASTSSHDRNGMIVPRSNSAGSSMSALRSPRIMTTSDSATSFATPLRDRSPSPYFPERDEVRDELMGVLTAFRACDPADLEVKLHLGSQVHRLLVDGSSAAQVKDDFREAGGFQVIVQMLSSLDKSTSTSKEQNNNDQRETKSSASNAESTPDEAHERLRVEIYKLALTIIHVATFQHHRNKMAFEKTVGWVPFAEVLKVSTIYQSSPERFFAGLLGLALGEVAYYITKLDKRKDEDSSEQASTEVWAGTVETSGALISTLVLVDELRPEEKLELQIFQILEAIGYRSKRNQIKMARAGLTSMLLKTSDRDIASPIKVSRQRLLQRLYSTGIPTEDCRSLLRNIEANISDSSFDILESVAGPSSLPNMITFDMHQNAHCSMAMSSLPRPFPPAQSSRGFTFFAPVLIEQSDPSFALELLHLFDSRRVCSVKIEVEPSTGHVTYKTSKESSPVTFQRSHIQPGRVHNICLIHIKPSASGRRSTSNVQLFIDGNFVQQEKAQWPNIPPAGSVMRAVFGTPPLVNKPKASNQLVWSLGPAYLLDDVLAPEMPLVISELASAGYSGNFQDSLGRFLTYSTSTKINLRLDSLARVNGANEAELSQNALVQVITDAARNNFDEEKFYFILNSANHYELDKIAKRSANHATTSSAYIDPSQKAANQMILNQAVTLTKDAIETSFGYAKLFGNPVLAPTTSLADTIWKLGGCAILLQLIDLSTTSAMLEKSLAFAFALIQQSWRLSEDIERIKGYEVLNYMLKRKKSLINAEILRLCCSAVGYKRGKEGEAALVNPFLYRIIMLDLNLWTDVSIEVRKAHLDQFVVFLKTSKYRRFNAKRVSKMQIARKILQTLQFDSSIVDTKKKDETMESLLAALRIALISSFNDAAIRSISTYLATQLYAPPDDPNKKKKSTRPPVRRQQTLAVGVAPSSHKHHISDEQSKNDRIEVAIRIFELLTDLVLERSTFLLKLGASVNIKWLLLFFSPSSDKRAASLALDIMTALLLRDKTYADRLTRSGGVKVLERLLPQFWNTPRIFSRCWSTLFDIDEQPGNTHLYPQFGARDNQTIFCPVMLRLILATLGPALHSINTSNKKKDTTLRPRPSEFVNGNSSNHSNIYGVRRSQSMNGDAIELGQAFQESSELQVVRDNVMLIEEHAQRSVPFCTLLFSTSNLRLLVSAIIAYVELEEDRKEAKEVVQMANRLLIVLANSAVESITSSASTRVVSAILDVVPPDSDLSTATNFRLALYDRIASAIGNIIIPGLGDVLDDQVRSALADFIEQCSGEVQNSEILQVVAKMLTAFKATRPSNHIIAALLTSLDRIVLFRLAAKSPNIWNEILEHQEIIFMDNNQDIAFFRCLLYNVISVLHGKYSANDRAGDVIKEDRRMSCYNTLILLSKARPALVESIIVPEMTLQDFRKATDVDVATTLLRGSSEKEDVPFKVEWEGFTKSRDSLKAALHLDRMSRVTQSLLSSDEKQKTIKSTEDKMMAWQSHVRAVEESRLVRVALDAKEMMTFAAGEWHKMMMDLKRERAVLGQDSDEKRVFELDSTEGPMRMRPKLRETTAAVIQESLPKDDLDVLEDEEYLMPIQHGDAWASADGGLSGPHEGEEHSTPKASPLEIDIPTTSLTREEGHSVDSHDDKYRRVIRSLEKGDVIEGVENSLRVLYIECRASLLIFGKKCFYIIDDYFQRPDGELCNLWEAPEEERDSVVMSTLDAEGKGRLTLIEQLEGNAQHTRKWAWADVKFVALKTFLHRKTAIEIHFTDGQSCLLVLANTAKADVVYRNLSSRNKGAAQAFSSLMESIREAGKTEGSRFSQFAGAVMGKGTGSVTQKWIDGKMSNFDYLMCLNTAAGRTYQDITQYPVMPWVLQDYTSENLDFDDPKSFRDLSLPMGAQEKTRRERFEERFRQLQEMEDMDPEATKPFHYGTHYSTAATVSGYLIRLRPFDKILKALQGGTFDLADRTFSSIGYAYTSASAGSLGDVRELIPEAYYLPEFLVNSNHFNFGSTQSGVVVDDVELPKWANGDPRLFIKLHREALESDYVSNHLHLWIDLIFGYKQRGEAAVEATNCFHELSYDNAVDLQTLDSSMEQQAVLKTIHMFGVCPRQLFQHAHPQRRVKSDNNEGFDLSLIRNPGLMTQSIAAIRTLHAAVHFIYAANQSKPFASPKDYLILPHMGLSLSVGHLDGSIRFFLKDNMSIVRNIVEQVMPDRISALVDASSNINVTSNTESSNQDGKILIAGMDGTLTAWRVDGSKKELHYLYACRGHLDSITCLDYCDAWNMAVSGSQDGVAIIWDSRGRYVKTLIHDEAVQSVTISQTSGLIATASGRLLRLWSINGDLIASVTSSTRESIACITFYEQDDQEASQSNSSLCTILTGHHGKIIAWSCNRKDGEQKWTLSPLHVFEHHNRLGDSSFAPLVTALKAKNNMIISGDDQGQFHIWSLPGKAVEIPHSISNICMNCDKKFGLFEKKINCAACGGLFCNNCSDIILSSSFKNAQFGNQKFCDFCRGRLQALLTIA